jgi:hypothetical protein
MVHSIPTLPVNVDVGVEGHYTYVKVKLASSTDQTSIQGGRDIFLTVILILWSIGNLYIIYNTFTQFNESFTLNDLGTSIYNFVTIIPSVLSVPFLWLFKKIGIFLFRFWFLAFIISFLFLDKFTFSLFIVILLMGLMPLWAHLRKWKLFV